MTHTDMHGDLQAESSVVQVTTCRGGVYCVGLATGWTACFVLWWSNGF